MIDLKKYKMGMRAIKLQKTNNEFWVLELDTL